MLGYRRCVGRGDGGRLAGWLMEKWVGWRLSICYGVNTMLFGPREGKSRVLQDLIKFCSAVLNEVECRPYIPTQPTRHCCPTAPIRARELLATPHQKMETNYLLKSPNWLLRKLSYFKGTVTGAEQSVNVPVAFLPPYIEQPNPYIPA